MRRVSGHHHRRQFDQLTPRQVDVLERIAAGKTNAEIAADLGIGFESAKTHVSDILMRLDVATREDAAEMWRTGSVPRRPQDVTAALFGWLASKAAVAVATIIFFAGISVAIYAASLRSNGDIPAIPEATPTASDPALADFPGLYPPGTRTGVASVDRVIEAVERRENQPFLDAIQYAPTACFASPPSKPFASCDHNAYGPGDIVDAFMYGACGSAEESWIASDSLWVVAQRGPIGGVSPVPVYLVSVSELVPAGRAGEAGPAAKYVAIFQSPNPATPGAVEIPIVVLIGDRGAVGTLTCGSIDEVETGIYGFQVASSVLPEKPGAKHRPPGPFLPDDTLSGVPIVDALLPGIMATGEVPQSLISWQTMPCGKTPGYGWPVDCAPGTSEGAPVEMVAVGGSCDGGGIISRHQLTGPLRVLPAGPRYLAAVFEEEPGTYVVAFEMPSLTQATFSYYYVVVDADGLVTANRRCATQLEDALAGASRVIVPPVVR